MLLAALTLVAQLAASPAPTVTPIPDPCSSIGSIVNRPTVSTTVCTVRDGHVMIENGFTNTTTTGATNGSTIAYPQSFVRFGIGQHTELNFIAPTYNRSSVGGALTYGASDIGFGMKWELGYNAKAYWGANVQVTAPSGDSAFTAGGAQYTANLNGAYTLSPRWSVGGTLGFNSLVGYSNFAPSALAAWQAGPNTSAIFEYAYVTHGGPSLGSKATIDFALEQTMGSNMVVDVEYGFQPTPLAGAKTHYIGAGISFMH